MTRRRLLETRIRRLRNPRAHAQVPPSRTSRIVGNVAVETERPAGADLLAVSNFQLVEYRRDRSGCSAARPATGRCARATASGSSGSASTSSTARVRSTLDGISVLF